MNPIVNSESSIVTKIHAHQLAAKSLETSGRHSESIAYWLRGLQLSEDTFGENHQTTLYFMQRAAQSFVHQRLFASAAKFWTRVHVLNTRGLGATHSTTLHCLVQRATTLDRLKQYDQAFPLWIELMETHMQMKGKALAFCHFMERAGICFEKLNPNDEAIRWWSKTYLHSLLTFGSGAKSTIRSLRLLLRAIKMEAGPEEFSFTTVGSQLCTSNGYVITLEPIAPCRARSNCMMEKTCELSL